jgi:RNA polymerase sigma-70 factor (ECF subfamily)
MDLVQSVHKSLILGLRDERFALSKPDDLIALALTMVRRKVARQWRRLQRQQRLSTGGRTTSELAHTLTMLSGPAEDPALAVQFRDQVAELCQNLADDERRFLELRLQDYTPQEIAAELGLSAVALRVRLTRLRQRLRAAGVLDDWL